MEKRLGVNIDHVATLRQARDESYPSVEKAAQMVIEAGADQITIHLREDRRHIQDFDPGQVQKITKETGKLLNFEMGCNEDITQIALELAPDWICLVPENREEKTTEGGLNLKDFQVFSKVETTVKLFRDKLKNTKISLFLEADLETLELAKNISVEAVEIHTGQFAHDFLQKKKIDHHLESFKAAQEYLVANDIKAHAGHGLTDESTKILVNLDLFEEYNIGHWIIAESVFQGIRPVVSNLAKIIKK